MSRNIRGVQLNSFDIFTSQAKAEFNGGGLGIGFGAEASILSCLHFSAELAAVGLVGSRHFDYLRVNTVPAQSVALFPANYSNTTAFVPGIDLRAKLAYVQTFCNMDFSLYLAWEVNQYWDSVYITDPPIAFLIGTVPVNTGILEGSRRCRNVGFGGPSVGASVGF